MPARGTELQLVSKCVGRLVRATLDEGKNQTKGHRKAKRQDHCYAERALGIELAVQIKGAEEISVQIGELRVSTSLTVDCSNHCYMDDKTDECAS